MLKRIFSLLMLILMLSAGCQPVLGQPANEVEFQTFNFHSYGTSDDYIPNEPLDWNCSWSYTFYNLYDGTGELFYAPYMNLTTTMTFDYFDPLWNTTGTTPDGTPYYIWNYTSVSLQPVGKWSSWGCSGRPIIPPKAPAFSVRRLYSPYVIGYKKRHVIQAFTTEINLEEETSLLDIRVTFVDTSEVSAMLLGSFFRVPEGASVLGSDSDAHTFFLEVRPTVGTYTVFILLGITNKLYPSPIKYVPEVSCTSYKQIREDVGLADMVTFTALDGSIITVAGKESYYWYVSNWVWKNVCLKLVCEKAFNFLRR